MRRVSMDLSLYRLRAGTVRVVDASSGNWGFISVDDFRFDWDVRGAQIEDEAAQGTGNRILEPGSRPSTPVAYTHTPNGKDEPGGSIETPMSGVAYTFVQHVVDR